MRAASGTAEVVSTSGDSAGGADAGGVSAGEKRSLRGTVRAYHRADGTGSAERARLGRREKTASCWKSEAHSSASAWSAGVPP